MTFALTDFPEECWRGITPVLWGGQLRQERLDALGVWGIDQLPVATTGVVDLLVPSAEPTGTPVGEDDSDQER